MLYRIIKKNQNKIFWTIGQFEFEYFGGSDVVNKLLSQVQLDGPHFMILRIALTNQATNLLQLRFPMKT